MLHRLINLTSTQHLMELATGFARVLESPGILFWHSPGQDWKVLEKGYWPWKVLEIVHGRQ